MPLIVYSSHSENQHFQKNHLDLLRFSKMNIYKLPKNNGNINGDFCAIIEKNQPNENKKKKDYKR